MTGSASYSRDADVAAQARVWLDEAQTLVGSMDTITRSVVEALVRMWPTAAWLAAGADSAKQWLISYTGLSVVEARRLERIAELCTRNDSLLDAVVEGGLLLGRAEKLARAVTDERAPLLTDDVVDAFLAVAGADDDFDAAVRYWRERVDENLAPRRVQTQSLTYSRRLFGGGDVQATLAPVAFETLVAAIDAFTQDPDPKDAPYVRTLSERRADGLDDMAAFALTHDPADDGECTEEDAEDETARAEDTYDGSYPGDSLDEALDPENEGLDALDLLRVKIRKAHAQQRRRANRRIRARSGACVNVLVDLQTLLDVRTMGDLSELVMLGDGWNQTRAAVEQMTCDAAMVATLFEGKKQVLDANDSAEQFSKRQRRAIAARDRHCVFPGCTRPPKHCDIHHNEERNEGGPTTVPNGCLLCRFHHRLLHQHRWKLHQNTDGDWTATDPHGTEWNGRRPGQPAAACASA